MKQLFIYYSDTGNGDAVAERLAASGCDVRKVTPVKPLPKSFFFKILKGGFLATAGKRAKLNAFDSDISAYDRIIIGSPVWNARLSTPANALIKKLPLENKETAFVLYSGSGTAPKAGERIRAAFPAAAILNLKEPKKYPAELDKLAEVL